jgi:hypothetical protein
MLDFIISISGYIVGLPLELLIIAAMLHGGYRQFPAIFAYIIAEFLSTVIEMPQALAYYRTHDPHIASAYAKWYWRDEIALQFLVLVVVMSLIWQATSAARSRRPTRAFMFIGIVLFAGISFFIHFDPHVFTGVWMTPWARDLNVGASVLDMMLWAMLIAKRQKDSRVLMLSAGLGLMFAGEAIGEALRTLFHSHAALVPADILMILTSLGFLYIWWQTFRLPRTVPIVSAAKL